ncbi:hypothetical protein LDENG_00011850 [Lucifuga dentata]|nr:hypothetical protein LDENG_00011850 [Lucifuga dentata]
MLRSTDLRTQMFPTSYVEKCVGTALEVGAPAEKIGQNYLPDLASMTSLSMAAHVEASFVNGNDQLKGE